VLHLQQEHGYSQRRACRLTGCNRNSARHVSRRSDDEPLRVALTELAQEKPAWGYRMLHGRLRLEGWEFNHKKAYRLYREEKLTLRKKSKKRFKCEKRGPVVAASHPYQRWSLDFIHDRLADGRSFRTLNLNDTFTRQCLAQKVDTSLSGHRIVRALDRAVAEYGLPQELQLDNGPECRSQAVDLWAYQHQVKLIFIEPGKPTQNGHIESFNGRFRAECLDQEWFGSLQQARTIIEAWRISYNSQRPHSSLGYLPPDVWTEKYYQQQKNLML
jgi:putative transposase